MSLFECLCNPLFFRVLGAVWNSLFSLYIDEELELNKGLFDIRFPKRSRSFLNGTKSDAVVVICSLGILESGFKVDRWNLEDFLRWIRRDLPQSIVLEL